MRVLEFSMREATTLAVEVSSIASFPLVIPLPRDLRNQPRTPFSFQRFLIPDLCGYQGRAIYLDADMQLFSDVGALWSARMDGYDLLTVQQGNEGRNGQFSVMLLNCERLQWHIESIVQGLDEGNFTYEQLMYEMCVAGSVGRILDPGWNSLEKYEPGQTRLLHYTDMDTQPWVSLNNPLGYLWVACLRRAINADFITREELTREIAAGYVRPSLLKELNQPELGKSELRKIDAGFVEPYRSIRSAKARPWTSMRLMLSFYVRRGLQRLTRSF
jgi:hypothetical protein